MDIQTYEQLFRRYLTRQRKVSLARSLAAAEKNQYVTQCGYSQIHEAKAHILAIEERVIREVKASGVLLEAEIEGESHD